MSEIIISCHALLKHVKAHSSVISSNSPIPILECILFKTEENAISMLSGDMDTMISSVVSAQCQKGSSLAIPAKTFQDILSNIPEQPLHLHLDQEKLLCKIKTENGDYTISCLNSQDYPDIPQVDAKSSVVLKSDVLLRSIDKTIFATSNDDIRQTMNGVYFNFLENEAVFVATDAHKLVKLVRKDVKNDQSGNFIMAKKPLNALRQLLAGIDDAVQISFSEKNAEFRFSQTTLVCKLIEGKYPNYEAVIPKNNPNKLTLDKSILLGVLKRISVFTNKITYLVRFVIKGSQLEIKAEDSDYANEGHEIMSCIYEGEDMEIGFNARFLQELISNIDSEQVIFEMSSPSRAGLIIPSRNAHPSEEMIMLVMPIMLNN